jgi:hypothetical protein
MGLSKIGIMGFGEKSVKGLALVPIPPAMTRTFISYSTHSAITVLELIFESDSFRAQACVNPTVPDAYNLWQASKGVFGGLRDEPSDEESDRVG